MTGSESRFEGGFKPTFEVYGPDSMMWRINRERIVLLGGAAAAVLQGAHPQVAFGVAAHSKFRSDPHGRLHRTLDAVYTVAFGTVEEVERVRKGVAQAHRSVQGEFPQPYSAFDPGAQLWVLATLIQSSVTMYRRFVGPLTENELDAFLKENVRFGEVFGVDPALLPRRWSDFQRYWDEMMQGSLLGSHPLCAEVANAIVCPDAPWSMRMLSPVFRALTVEYFSPALQERLRLSAGFLGGSLWRFLDNVLPTLLRCAPASLRFDPHYLRALHRQNGVKEDARK